jgi:hypothetical protein
MIIKLDFSKKKNYGYKVELRRYDPRWNIQRYFSNSKFIEKFGSLREKLLGRWIWKNSI